MHALTDAPFRYYITKPILVRALVIGEDIDLAIEGVDAERGDFVLENPDPITAAEEPFYFVPRQEFLAHYEPTEDPNAAQKGLRETEVDSPKNEESPPGESAE